MVRPEDRKTCEELACNANSGRGIACPNCGCSDFRIPHTWHVLTPGVFAKRQRLCRHCGEVVYNTKEIIDD